MIILNVSFGIYAFLPHGWVFMAFVIFLECIVLRATINFNLSYKRSFFISLVSNAVSGIIGIIVSLMMNGGWWLVVWFPWVSDNEVNLDNPQIRISLYIYYACAFVVTLILESGVNWLMLKKTCPTKKILKTTLIVNIISYAIGSLVLYTYSFS